MIQSLLNPAAESSFALPATTQSQTMDMKNYCYFESPIGRLMLRGTVGVLEELHFANSPAQQKSTAGDFYDETSFQAVTDQLNEYFAGRRQTFNVKLAPQGTDFQQQVWLQLSKIPYGQAVSYSHIAEQIGNPKANRAVGLANGKNPLPIIVPCHRVIGKDGSLTGFGGGLDVKRFLLNLEGYVI